MRDATSSDGLHVVLKVIDDTDELEILKHLNGLKSEANHTIELHGVIHTPIAKVIALQWKVPLDEYIRFHHPPESAALFPKQLLEGVAFLHEHRVAHPTMGRTRGWNAGRTRPGIQPDPCGSMGVWPDGQVP